MKAVRSFWDRLTAFVRRRLVPVTAGAVIVVLATTAGVVWTLARPTGPEVDCSGLQTRGAAAANVLAVACGAEVEVTDERTPWASSWAGSDGTFRLEVSAVPERTLINGAWVAINPDLVVGEDSIAVAAPVFPIFLNAGGAAGAGKPLGTIERDGHLFQIWFPLDLPVPTVEKSRVFYRLGDGIRLAVTVNSDTTGFIPVVELANPEAASAFADMLAASRMEKKIPGSGIELGFPIEVPEALTLSVDEFSQMQAVDAVGDVQFSAPPPTMWDSSGATVVYGPEVTEVASTDRLIQPSAGDRVATMAVTLAGSTMVVTPDAELMSGAGTVWPVYLDPTISGYGAAQRIAVRTGGYTSTLNQWVDATSSSPGQGTGYCSEVSSCNVQFKQRLVWRFDGLTAISGLVGTDIVSASFTVNGTHSYGCSATTTTLYRTSTVSASSTWSSVSWAQALGARTESQRSSCATNGYRSFDAKAGFVWAADNNSSTLSLGLLSSETSMTPWKRFAYDAKITVSYNRAPNTPTSQQLTSPSVTSCTTGVGRPAIATTTPTVSAVVSDPDATAVNASFEVAPVSSLTAPVWSSGNVTAVVSGSRASIAVPTGKLSNGVAYAWRTRGYDGSRYGAWSGWCEFVVDTAAPSVPTVSPVTVEALTVYRENTERSGVGLQGLFTVHRNADSDVVAFQYGFNAPTMPLSASPDNSGAASISFTPTTAGPVTLTIRSRDAAGNFSAARTYTFTVATPTEDGIWTLDEGTGSTAADSAGSPNRPLTVGGAQWGDGPHTLFDSREGDFALEFDGVNDFAQTAAPVVDTTGSFALSAHVLLDPSRVGGSQSLTVLSQDGVQSSGLRLEYRASCPGTTDGCWAFAMPDNVAGTAETVVQSTQSVIGGQWTHLVAAFDAPADKMQLWVCEVGTPEDPAIGEPTSYSVPRTAPPWAATSGLQLGRSLAAGSYSSFWDGSIDNVRVFDGQVLSEAKIRRLCQGAEATDFPQGNDALDPTNPIGG